MNVLSLFDGISAGHVALERAGIKVDTYFASEIDKNAIEVTMNNFPDTVQLGDINNWEEWNLPHIDLLLAGSPCQGFSFAGKGLNFEDERSKLFFVFVDILNAIKPEYFLLENVKMKHEYRNIISEFVGIQPVLINSNLVSAQNRGRYYWTNIPNVSVPEDKHVVFEDIEYTYESVYWSNEQMRRFANHEYVRNDYYRIEPVKGKVQCLMAQMGTNKPKTHSEGKNFRVLNPIEWERLQTFPDNYTGGFSNHKRYKMLGNSWTVDVIVHILQDLKNA